MLKKHSIYLLNLELEYVTGKFTLNNFFVYMTIRYKVYGRRRYFQKVLSKEYGFPI